MKPVQPGAMLIHQTAEYAIRAMARLAVLPPGGAMRARDLALETGIPLAYLSKVLRRQVLGGLLVSRRGHGGGFALSRPAAAIRFAEILAAADYAPDADHCAYGWEKCNGDCPCPLHPTWSRLKERFREWTEQTTLADVDVNAFANRSSR